MDQEFHKYSETGAYHWAQTYDKPVWRRSAPLMARYDLAVRIIRRSLRAGSAGVDVGCGDGVMIYRLSQGGFIPSGIDMADDGLECARDRLMSRGVAATLSKASAYDIPAAADSQDFVTCIEVIEHLDDPLRFLKEARRVLRPGGLLVCTTPQRALGQRADEVRDPYHFKEYIAEEFQAELQQVFERVEVNGAYPAILNRLYKPNTDAGLGTKVVRLVFRLSAASGLNPYLLSSNPVRPSDELLVGVAAKYGGAQR